MEGGGGAAAPVELPRIWQLSFVPRTEFTGAWEKVEIKILYAETDHWSIEVSAVFTDWQEHSRGSHTHLSYHLPPENR